MPVERRRYVTLDAMRGVAAAIVVLCHAGHKLGAWSPAFGHLAVDLFFGLSGFVIAHSYDARLAGGAGVGDFLKRRLIRLGPLYLTGLALGAATCLLNPDFQGLTPRVVAFNLPFNLVGLPAPGGWRPDQLFPLNVVFWSLFFELAVNLVYAAAWPFLKGPALYAVVAACAAGLVGIEKIEHTLSVGMYWHDAWQGLLRAGFSFFAGVALRRLHGRRPASGAPSVVIVAVSGLLLLPRVPGPFAHMYELAVVLLAFPALIYLAAGAVERAPRIGETLGDMSYAAYVVHYPLWVLASWALAHAGMQPHERYAFAFLLAITALALGLDRADRRVQAALKRRFLRGRVKSADVYCEIEGSVMSVADAQAPGYQPGR